MLIVTLYCLLSSLYAESCFSIPKKVIYALIAVVYLLMAWQAYDTKVRPVGDGPVIAHRGVAV